MPDIKFASSSCTLQPAPINPAHIKAGNPVARNHFLYVSEDGTARTMIWDCSAGTFDWIYDEDETVYVIEGSVSVKTPAGSTTLRAGDTAYFPGGTRAEWTVGEYVRKIAVLRYPLGKELQAALRVARAVRRRVGLGR